MIIDKELISRYEHFHDNVTKCYTLLIAGQPYDPQVHQQILDLIAMSAGQAMGIAYYMGLSVPKPQPWVALGISRSTYYRDQRKSKQNERLVNIGPAYIPGTNK